MPFLCGIPRCASMPSTFRQSEWFFSCAWFASVKALLPACAATRKRENEAREVRRDSCRESLAQKRQGWSVLARRLCGQSERDLATAAKRRTGHCYPRNSRIYDGVRSKRREESTRQRLRLLPTLLPALPIVELRQVNGARLFRYDAAKRNAPHSHLRSSGPMSACPPPYFPLRLIPRQ